MAVYSVIDFDKFHPGIIFDPEHYHPDRISSLTKLSFGSKKTISNYFQEMTILSAQGINAEGSDVFDLTDTLGCFLREGEKPEIIGSTKKQALSGDIVISRLRSYLKEMCIIPARGDVYAPLLSTEYIVLRKNSSKKSDWLLAFLLSDPVQTILMWSQTGSNHPRFSANTLLKLPIPNSVIGIRETVSDIVRSAISVYERGKELYPEAERELLERIGWEKLQRTLPELFFVEEFNNLDSSNRVDAEHFQPQFKRLQDQLLGGGAEKLGSFCPMPNRGVQPIFIENGDVVVVASKAVRPNGISPDDQALTSKEFYNNIANSKARILKGDVLLNSTGVGTLGRASFCNDNIFAMADNHVAIIRPDNNICLPVYLSLFLNSQAGLLQTEKFQTGSSGQLEIYPQHIQELLIFVPKNKNGSIDLEWQKKLSDKVLGASRAKQEAQAKLDKAKRLVEEAIERNGFGQN